MSQSCLFLGVSKAGIVENILWWYCWFWQTEIYREIEVYEYFLFFTLPFLNSSTLSLQLC